MPAAPAFAIDCFDDALSARTTPEEGRRILALRDHPRFLEGLFGFVKLMPPYFEDNVILNKIVTEAWRLEILVYAVHLHDTRDPDDPRGGLTVSNLCKRQICASRGRVLAILGIMRLDGFLHLKQAADDRRVVRLEPSERFVAIVEGWSRIILTIIDRIAPEGGLASDHAAHARFGRDMRRRGALRLLEGWKLLAPFPEVGHFVSRDGGWMLLLTCVGEAMRSGEGRAIHPSPSI